MTMAPEPEPGDDLPERWSAKAQSDVVLRLFRGEAVSRDVQVPLHELESWRRSFLEGGWRGCAPAMGSRRTGRSSKPTRRWAN